MKVIARKFDSPAMQETYKKRPRMMSKEEQYEEDRIRWIRLCRTSPVQTIHVLQESPHIFWPGFQSPSGPFQLVKHFSHTIRLPYRTTDKYAERFHDAVYGALQEPELQHTPRFNRWHRRHLIREWNAIVVEKSKNALKKSLLELNSFTYLWISLSIPTCFLVQNNGRYFATLDFLQSTICKARLDIVPHWKDLTSTSPFGACHNLKALCVVFLDPPSVPLLHGEGIMEWRSSSNLRIYGKKKADKNEKIVNREELNNLSAKIERV